jgi:hypothetical protein
MARIVAVIALFLGVGAGVVGYAEAQEAQDGTPSPELCATPEASPGASPGASPEGSPEIITSGTPEVIATSVTENIETGIQNTVCGTPEASPTM